MFHAVSHAAALLLTPTNALVLLILLGMLIGVRKRAAWARRVAAVAAIALAVLAILPIGDWLLTPLEGRFGPFVPDGSPVAGIIVLGGSISAGNTPNGRYLEPNQAVDRIFEAARLAHLYPEARVLVVGGPEQVVTHASEADTVARYLVKLGVPQASLVKERLSKDTFENARFSSALVQPKSGQRWLLVTSAAHMPRAIACFRKAGFMVRAAPADWRRGVGEWPMGWSASGNLGAVDLAWKEYLGLVAYRLSGRTSELFPGPQSTASAVTRSGAP
jgi:uncharacterized SAM-binding protein YcdF (DUF218 family)